MMYVHRVPLSGPSSKMEVSELNNYVNTSIIFLMNHTATMQVYIYMNL